MKKLLFTLFLVQLSLLANDSGLLYNGVLQKLPATIFYNAKHDTYEVNSLGRQFIYKRFHVKDLLRKHYFDFPSEDIKKIESTLLSHASVIKLSNPTSEEMLSDSMEASFKALNILDPASEPCGGYKAKNESNTFSFEKSLQEKLNNEILEFSLNDDGFFGLGKLEGIRLELMTENDNLLHGLAGSSGLGITEYSKRPEGDDRGKTFVIDQKVALEFEKGEIGLRYHSTGYGRKVSYPGNTYTVNGQEYTSRIHRDEEGRYFQEFMTIEGLDLELKRVIGSDGKSDVYVKVIGKLTTMDDASGVAGKLQSAWHELANDFSQGSTIRYNYVDHMKKQTGLEGEVEFGKPYLVLDRPTVSVTVTPALGAQVSALGDYRTYVRAYGEVKAEFYKEDKTKEKFPSWTTKLYLEGKAYSNNEKASTKGVEVRKYFQVTDNGAILITAGVEDENDVFNRMYGVEELKRNGKVDLNHKLGIFYEYQFEK